MGSPLKRKRVCVWMEPSRNGRLPCPKGTGKEREGTVTRRSIKITWRALPSITLSKNLKSHGRGGVGGGTPPTVIRVSDMRGDAESLA